MYRPLSPCPSCQRHVLASVASCPFCGEDTSEVQARTLPASAHQQMRRSALVMLGATLALGATGLGATGLVGCGGSKPPVGPPDDDGGTMAKYGAPAPPDDDGAPAAEYGAPVPPDDDGGAMPKYGAPAPPDDDGGAMAKYGAPAPPNDNGGGVEAYGAPAPLDKERKPKKP